ncbi:MAG: ATP-dependent RNA helicase RhlB [Pontibacterium sp.]
MTDTTRSESTNPAESSASKSKSKNSRGEGRPPRHRNRNRRHNNNHRRSWSATEYKLKDDSDAIRFDELGLPDQVLQAIDDLGFEQATPIQGATIPLALKGKDIIGKAQTGTGKTAAFLLGIITDLIDYPLSDSRRLGEPRALIIAPTRELALQIASDAVGLAKYAGLHIVSLVGGMDYDKQRQKIQKKPVDILVATPGRLLDFVKNREVDLYNVEVLVLDEADRMLSMGFIPDVRQIIRETPRKGNDRQTLLYSATFTDDVMDLARMWTFDPMQIEIESENKTSDNISQTVYLVSGEQKYALLRNYIRLNNVERMIVFGNRRHETRDLCERLRKDGHKAALMSGEISQQKRVSTLKDFADGKIEVLVATDVAGRGIHIDGVTHVVNYQLPDDPDDYVHRIGRTGRAGAEGTSICFACEDDSFMLPEIEVQTGVKLTCIHPEGELLAAIDPQAAQEAAAQKEAAATEEAQSKEQEEAPITETPAEADAVETTASNEEAEVATVAETAAEVEVKEDTAPIAQAHFDVESDQTVEAVVPQEQETEVSTPAEPEKKDEQRG